jgi:hypothetical protein
MPHASYVFCNETRLSAADGYFQFSDRGLPVPSYAANSVPSSSGAGKATTAHATAGAAAPKSEDVAMDDGVNHFPVIPEENKPRLYTVYDAATDVPYQPEGALTEGLGMVKTLKARIKKLQLGSRLRQDVWLREIERYLIILLLSDFFLIRFLSLETQGAPTTMIAVCGGMYYSNFAKRGSQRLLLSHWSREIVYSQCYSRWYSVFPSISCRRAFQPTNFLHR